MIVLFNFLGGNKKSNFNLIEILILNVKVLIYGWECFEGKGWWFILVFFISIINSSNVISISVIRDCFIGGKGKMSLIFCCRKVKVIREEYWN